MPFLFISQSLRAILPRVELRKSDQLPGAYPVVSKTGDPTRTGRNKVFFDDTRTVVFNANVAVTYPTTFQTDTRRVGSDLTGTLGQVTGNVDKFAIEQFILPHTHVEPVGPFREANLYELDQRNVYNSSFMTGTAYSLAPDRFKSSLANKTIIRLEIPLTHVSQLTPSSSIHYLNPTSGAFVTKFENERSFNASNQAVYPNTFAPLPFTPYGMHYLPLGNQIGGGMGTNISVFDAKNAYRRITTFAGDGYDFPFFESNPALVETSASSSVLNPAHAASALESINLSDYLSHPFLLEKAVVEFPFAAGPGWLNDRFGMRTPMENDLLYTMDAGGPMVTFALMRQDKSDIQARDIIASGTITNALDMTTGTYTVNSASYGGVGGYTDVSITPEGLGWFANPSVVITGSVLSGSTNTYTGSIRMVLEPQITSHVWRLRVSGSAIFYWNAWDGHDNSGNNAAPARETQATGIGFGPIARRSTKQLASSRNVLGNHFALIDTDTLNGALNPVKSMDSQYESLPQDHVAPRYHKAKIIHDVVSHTIKSPYLLHPQDRIQLCLSKHRAVGSPDPAEWDFAGDFVQPTKLVAYHDVSVLTGTLKLTLYGDLIKEDREFHDTLNQRLETPELWQTIGEDPILDQFDVSYQNELSGTYTDRFNVLNAISSINYQTLSSSLRTSAYHSNFTSDQSGRWSSEYKWSNNRTVDDLKKSNRNVNLVSSERFWDTRLPDPVEVMGAINPNLRLEGYDFNGNNGNVYTANNILYTGTQVTSSSIDISGFSLSGDRGLRDWMMVYPYESKFDSLSKVFADSIASARRDFKAKFAGSGGSSTAVPVKRYLGDINLIVGDDTASTAATLRRRRFAGEPSTSSGGTLRGVTFPEFIKIFYGIGDGRSKIDNQHVLFYESQDRGSTYQGVRMRGWRYGMMNGFPVRSKASFRRDRFGQFRDMLEQRLDAKFYISDENFAGHIYTTVGVKEGPVQVRFYDREGNPTDPLLTLSSNVSFEATSSVPYADGIARNRSEIDYSSLNIGSVTL